VIGLGRFGFSISKHVLLAGKKLRVYLRPESVVKRAKEIEELKKFGDVKIFEGTLEDKQIDLIRGAATGVDVVVVAIAIPSIEFSDERTVAHYLEEENVIHAIKNLHIKRYVPNEWGLPAKAEHSPLFIAKDKIHEMLIENKIPYTRFYVGLISEGVYYFGMNEVFGDGNAKIYLSTLEDIGRITVKASLDERTLNKSVYIHSEELSQREILDTLKKDINSLPKLTSEELDKRLAQKKEKNENTAVDGYIKAFFFDKQEEPSGTLHIQDLYPDENLVKLNEYNINHNSY